MQTARHTGSTSIQTETLQPLEAIQKQRVPPWTIHGLTLGNLSCPKLDAPSLRDLAEGLLDEDLVLGVDLSKIQDKGNPKHQIACSLSRMLGLR